MNIMTSSSILKRCFLSILRFRASQQTSHHFLSATVSEQPFADSSKSMAESSAETTAAWLSARSRTRNRRKRSAVALEYLSFSFCFCVEQNSRTFPSATGVSVPSSGSSDRRAWR